MSPPSTSLSRRELLTQLASLGAAAPFLTALLSGCDDGEGLYWDFEVNFTGEVLIIGAGAAGLAAGYILERYGVPFRILEASADFGGRVKRSEGFADFPIDLGAEWIHDDPSVLAELIDDPSVDGAIDVIPYSPDTASVWHNGRLTSYNWGANYYSEYKFKRTTWYDFLASWIVPSIAEHIQYDTPIVAVDYTGERAVLTDTDGNTYEADRVLVTAPLAVLQRGIIDFSPPLPQEKTRAINSVEMPDGIKVFIEFSERFYPDVTLVGPPLSYEAQEKVIYDAAFRKDSDRHILGLFCVGPEATAYTELGSDQAVVDRLLGELDEMFEGRATPAYKQHVVQNWSKEPYIRGAYSYDHPLGEQETITALREPVDARIYFSGEAMSYGWWATVNGAMQASYTIVEVLLKDGA